MVLKWYAYVAAIIFLSTLTVTVTFNSWLEQELLPHLNENAVVVIDNAAFHKSK